MRVSEAADRSTLKLNVRQSSSRRHPLAHYVGRQTAAIEGRELELSTLCCRSIRAPECRQCSVSGRSSEISACTVTGPFRSFRHPGDCGTNGRSQGTADIVGRRRAAEHVPVRQLNRGRRHSASKADRMSASRRIQLAHPTLSGIRSSPKSGRILTTHKPVASTMSKTPRRTAPSFFKSIASDCW
jgi:hypothetical protein